ncbi:MAG: lipid-A-disaccharide synthase [Gammaproteobacteria bacterium]|nr:MAG: lipid-A-disaccharide synthase [Gammaproteobacteria bacterium]
MLIYLVAGEASGDILGAGLMKSLQSRFPTAQFKGIGGPLMQAQGLECFYPFERLSVMGIVPILMRYFELIKMRKRLKNKIIEDNSDCFIGIDAPVFNTDLEYQLTNSNITCVHYVSPSVWAWRENRIFKIVKSVRLMLCLFPFELPIYKKHNLSAVCVGHPLADEIPLEPDMHQARKKLKISDDAQYLAILPGSRGSETKFLIEPFINTAIRLKQTNSGLNFIIPCANKRRRIQIEKYLKEHPVDFEIKLVDGQSRDVMLASDIVLLASGTATLEAMLLKKPMVVAYKVSTFSYFIYSRLLKIKNFSLPNLLNERNEDSNSDGLLNERSKELVKEFMQDECTVDNLSNAINELFKNNEDSNKLISEFTKIHKSLRKNGNEIAAEAISQLLAK